MPKKSQSITILFDILHVSRATHALLKVITNNKIISRLNHLLIPVIIIIIFGVIW